MLTALSQLNIELSSRCDKATLCHMCGHQSAKDNPNLNYGDMDFALLEKIRAQVEPPIVISYHRDGDPLVYPRLGDALDLFIGFPISIVTHGEALAKRAHEIVNRCTTVTVSVIPKDPDREIQLEAIRGFLEYKGPRAPVLQLKFVGHIENPEPYEAFGVPIIGRRLHSKRGNWSYQEDDPPVPEIRVCLELLGHPCVDWRGKVFACQRLAPNDEGLIGDLNTQSLDEIWNGPVRAEMLRHHLAGRRDLAGGLCPKCRYWGIPAA
jgi:radical SAM protein with 4Fe4S-binding SPASM domain